MRAKKSEGANLEKRRKGFLLMGLTVACAMSLTAFEWITYEKSAYVLPPLSVSDLAETEVLQPFRKEQKKVERSKNPDKVIISQIVPDPDPIIPDPEPEPEPDPDPIVWEPVTFDPEPVDTTPFQIVEEMPEFEGGEAAMFKWMSQNVNYPQICIDGGIEGRVWVNFVVDENGNVTKVKVVNEEHKALEKEATRMVRAMPKWKPGKQQGKRVKVFFNLPIDFKLR